MTFRKVILFIISLGLLVLLIYADPIMRKIGIVHGMNFFVPVIIALLIFMYAAIHTDNNKKSILNTIWNVILWVILIAVIVLVSGSVIIGGFWGGNIGSILILVIPLFLIILFFVFKHYSKPEKDSGEKLSRNAK